MRTNKLLQFAVITAAFFTSSTISVRAEGPPSKPADLDAVVLTGWLHVEDYDFDDATVKVEVNGEAHSAPISKTGRFDISLPSGTEAVLRFEHPGHLSKELVVDTRYASEGEAGKHARHVRFAVILELERHLAGRTYAGPVGNIGFDKDGGCLAIDHTCKLVVGRRNTPMVF